MSTSVVYVGIDPGKSGGITFIHPNGVVEAVPMPGTDQEICDHLRTAGKDAVVVIEKVHAYPRQGVVSSFNFGKGYGGLLMALTCLHLMYYEVSPQKWQKSLGIEPAKKKGTGAETQAQWKWRLKEVAEELHPDAFRDVNTKRHALAISDALLIATYCERLHEGEQAHE